MTDALPRGPHSLLEASYSQRRFLHKAPASTKLEHIANPRWWAGVAGKLAVLDEVVIFADDNSWRAEVIVLQVSRVEAFVQIMSWIPLDLNAAKLAASADPYRVEADGAGKWRVHRNADNAVVADGLPSRKEADRWMADHMKQAA